MPDTKVEPELPAKPDIVDFESFNTAFMEYQESMRKELRKRILDETKTTTGLFKKGMINAADIVWNPDEGEDTE